MAALASLPQDRVDRLAIFFLSMAVQARFAFQVFGLDKEVLAFLRSRGLLLSFQDGYESKEQSNDDGDRRRTTALCCPELPDGVEFPHNSGSQAPEEGRSNISATGTHFLSLGWARMR